MIDILQGLKPAPFLRPALNIGCGFDILTGQYYTGKFGESLLSGGVSHLTGIVGRGNMFKTALMLFMMIRVLDRYAETYALIYDNEMSLTIRRIQNMLREVAAALMDCNLAEAKRLVLVDRTLYTGDEWYEWLKTTTEERRKMKKEDIGVTPFIDNEGKNVEILVPFLNLVDSLSQFATNSVMKMQENDIGESERNMEFMRDGAAKTQMLMELPTLSARNGLYVMFTAHVGDEIAMNPMAPPQKKLTFLKNQNKLKNVPEKFTFLMNNCWYVNSATPLMNQATKAPEFPRDSEDAMRGDTDLMLLNVTNLRGKSGPTGMPFEVVVSQSEGVKVGLTEFNYIRNFDRFGLGGSDRNYFLELCPDISLSRTTIRGKIEESAKLRRALEITCEMCQIANLWHNIQPELICTPKQLYDDLKMRGYDWDVLLATRGYWTFNNEKHPVPYLSTMDLLNMRAGLYKPYWMH